MKSQGLMEEQRDDIDLLFAETIQTNGPLTMTETWNVMSESVNFLEFVSDLKMVKKVYDRVNYLKKRQAPEMLSKVDEQDRTLVDNHSTKASDCPSTAGSRTRWHLADAKAIADTFKNLNL